LDASSSEPHYVFRYTQGALKAEREQGFRPLVAFPDFDTVFRSNQLFPLFQNRVLNAKRPGFADYLLRQ
jgi:hypothetical protein